ncbi:hypothetical protein FAIPA1_310025 [Frankia sp. AiPs1]|uniref:Scr1 family TA system antitoxin-like transcriptional regulator n=1 Tax=Frankia sp. AiPa1 TaxID=573492 RepID=UPI00202BA05D|nr:Scr1 family TA system antitoxin-like transcriptional regulator [Frankia sp. AiPa1]MCL9762763.1 DUF5753 domain-containing protein [Frankia sp. AiPa1]
MLEEPVLLRPAGEPSVMRDQLQHLLAVATRPGVTVQVVPLAAGVHPALGPGFSLLDFQADQPSLVYAEDAGSASAREPDADERTLWGMRQR